MKNSLLKLYALVALVAGLAALSFVGGLYVGESSSPDQANAGRVINFNSSSEDVDFNLFWEVWNLLDSKYVPPTVGTTTDVAITDQQKLYSAIQGLTQAYGDPYTVFLPPKEAKTFEEDVSGNFEGVGIEIGVRDGFLTVIAPLKGTPADRAGIQAGDIILEVDGKQTATMSIDDAIDLIRGEKGTVVILTIGRAGLDEPLDIPVTRDQINVPSIETELRDRVFIISLYNFSATSPYQFREALREFVQARTDKLIIDLRGNPGGYLEASIDMASWFMPSGKVVVKEEFGDGSGESYRSKGYDIFKDNLKLAVLINGGSASASEILAGALQEQVGATLVGTRTFGKGSVQELIRLDGGTSLKVTIARWLTPSGVSISDGGLAPDIEVELTQEDILADSDPQLDRAIEHLNSL